MINWDRHEIDSRGEIETIIDVYQINSALVGFPDQIKDDFIVLRRDALPMITDELYKMLLREMRLHAKRTKPN